MNDFLRRFRGAGAALAVTASLAGAAVAGVDDHPNAPPGTLIAVDGTPAPGTIEVAGDVDVFTFNAVAGRLYTIATAGPSDTVLTLLDAGGAMVAFDDDGGPGLLSLIQWAATATGPLHAQVALFSGTGTYSISVVEQIVTDDHPNAPPGTGITIGTPVTAVFDYAGDLDVFTFTAQLGTTYRIETSGILDTVVSMYDSNGALISGDDDGGPGWLSLLHFTAPATGTYHVEVANFYVDPAFAYSTGPYGLRVTVAGADDHGNVPPGTKIRYNAEPTLGVIEVPGDGDFFEIRGLQGLPLTISTDGLVDTIIELYGPNGVFLATDDDGGPGLLSQLQYTPTASSSLYARVVLFGFGATGAYTIRVTNP